MSAATIKQTSRRILQHVLGEDRTRALAAWLEISLPGLGGKRTFAEFGEDVILANIFQNRPVGFYVDVGAHHPIRESNTYLLYRWGWRGINIDASPWSVHLLQRFRPRDINIQALVSNQERSLTFHCFGLSSMNTVDPARAEAFKNKSGHAWTPLTLHSRSLRTILSDSVPAGTHIDLLSVDAEGHDLAVLESNDWERFAPTVIIAEAHFPNLSHLLASPLHLFLHDRGYELINMLGPSLIFIRSREKNHPHWPFIR
ncbi:MAG: FkbM family methyltransferase [Magnetococcales bacterium]|nr:FkbM family methyltransferase [Magnetococcales bacterium]MBF0323064.1 FkbM family methyltransferase [Magnetococcales bacterium]